MKMDDTIDVRSVFLEEARAQGMEVRRTLPDGRIVVAVEAEELTVGLDNISRNVARDRDAEAVKRFVSALRKSLEAPPPWPEAKRGICYSAEPADHQFGDTIRQSVTDDIVRVLVYVDPEETSIRWLQPADLKQWGITEKEAHAIAQKNLAALLAQTPLHVEPVQRHRLAMFETASVFKAALIFAPNLKQVVQPKLGWPVYAVVPSRDFAYVFPKRDKGLIPRIGRVVVNEYNKSGYPISTDVLEISDTGIRSIGTFPADQ